MPAPKAAVAGVEAEVGACRRQLRILIGVLTAMKRTSKVGKITTERNHLQNICGWHAVACFRHTRMVLHCGKTYLEQIEIGVSLHLVSPLFGISDFISTVAESYVRGNLFLIQGGDINPVFVLTPKII